MPKYHCFFAHYQPLKILKWAQNWAALKTCARSRKNWARAGVQILWLSASASAVIFFSALKLCVCYTPDGLFRLNLYMIAVSSDLFWYVEWNGILSFFSEDKIESLSIPTIGWNVAWIENRLFVPTRNIGKTPPLINDRVLTASKFQGSFVNICKRIDKNILL